MILVGNQRGGGRDLARHLLKDENERVVVHEIRGFASNDLHSAFQESHAISQGTRCKQHLYSLSVNPPKGEDVSIAVFEEAIERAEEQLGLTGQPRAFVFHEKRGTDGQLRRHAHAVWCRIDVETMRAIQLSYDRKTLNGLARDLYREHGWTMPRGFIRHEERNPTNYTLAEWQQAKRAGRDPVALKQMIQDCWMISDSKTSFEHALRENGFVLARGDKRGAVAVDHTGEAFPIARVVGITSKRLKERLGDLNDLPSREEGHREIAQLVTARLKELQDDQRRIARRRLERFAQGRKAAIAHQQKEAQRQKDKQAERLKSEQHAAEARIRKGWRGLLDRVTGRKKRTEAENQQLIASELKRAQDEREALTQAQNLSRKKLMASAAQTKALHKENLRELSQDIERLTPPQRPEADKATDRDAMRDAYVQEQKREAFKTKRTRTPTAQRKKRRSNNPSYSRDGPSLGR